MEKLKREIDKLAAQIDGYKSSLSIEGIDPKTERFDKEYKKALISLRDFLKSEEERLASVLRGHRRR
jgi:hypothetical protein